MDLDQTLQDFVEAHVGKITSINKPDSGASRITHLIKAEAQECVLRVDSGDGPVANTPLTLAREASAYRALAGSGVRIPGLIDETENAFLMEMASGTPDLAGLEPEATYAIMDSLIDALAELHGVDASSDFEALDPPPDATQAATHNLNLWAGIYRTRVKRDNPLAEFATQWLAKHAPKDAQKLTVCHGDVGPGNFMHDGRRVTALLDWEFVHVGDPMDDLGWLAFRGHHLNEDVGDFDAQLQRWQDRTGLEVSGKRIAYYRIMVMYIFLVSCLAALDQGAKNQDRFVYLNLINLTNVIMPKAMMAFMGEDLPELTFELKPQDSELSEHLNALGDLIRINGTEATAGQDFYAGLMIQQMQSLAQSADEINTLKRDTYGSLIGRSVTDGEANKALCDWLQSGVDREADTLTAIYTVGLRRIQGDVVYLPAALKPFLTL